MKGGTKYFIFFISFILGCYFIAGITHHVYGTISGLNQFPTQPGGTERNDTTRLIFPLPDDDNMPYSVSPATSPLYLGKPSNIQSDIIYNPETRRYEFSQKVGELNFSPPASMSFDEYLEYDREQSVNNYWREKSRESSGGAGPSFMQSLRLGSETLDKVFGTDAINITPQGSAELIFGYNISTIDNPSLSVRNRRNGSFTFKEKIQMNVTGSIGDKMELGLNYNTEATFDFENKTKIEYAGKEDEIIKKIEAGNVTFPLPGSLIRGSQSLFGLKTELQFGKLSVTNVFSHQKGESSSIQVQGGAQLSEFEVSVDEYDANRHFFLSHFFKDHYNQWLSSLPYIESGVRIEQIEVWVTNKTSDFDNARNIVALMDLAESFNPDGEPNFYGDQDFIQPRSMTAANNNANALYDQISGLPGIRNIKTVSGALKQLSDSYSFNTGRDYERIENARKLTEREYAVNRELGYISLNNSLRNDEVLAVAFVYTYQGKTYKVGELSTDGFSGDNTLIVKMLKGTSLVPRYPTWELMMKNIYSIGAYQVSRQDFRLDVLYRNDETGVPVNYITEGAINEKILLKVLRLDSLDSRNEPNPDGVFDFIEGVTVYSQSGKIIFPLREPFGHDLRLKIIGGEQYLDHPERNRVADKYVFEELYDSTQTKAQQIAEKNKFLLSGQYQSSSSSEIQLNAMNIPEGSVKVTAGGIQLVENVDYTVDYTLGRVRVLNQGLMESGTPLNISLESQSLFNIQTKTLVGTHLDYRFSEDFNIGATLLNLTERPLTKKVNMGEEPISNTIWGLNTSYRTRSQFLTTLVDKLPFLETKETSSIALDAEFAHLIPGQSKAIGRSGVAYIDDFEGSQTKIEMKSLPAWVLSSAPQGLPQFPEAELSNNIAYGVNRAKLAWYVIDPVLTRNQSLTPKHITEDDQSSHYVREIREEELFPYKESEYSSLETRVSVLNVAYYPDEKGPYNYDVAGLPGISEGITPDGKLRNPESRWGGMMREIQTSDFETSNVEFIEFWMMDPFVEDSLNPGGELYFHLGEISEDILRDSRKMFENGLPVSDTGTLVDETAWGRVPQQQSYVTAFDNDPATREYQDVGLDGLRDDDEQEFFSWYLDSVRAYTGEEVYLKASEDPSNDNFTYYLGDDLDGQQLGILERYKNYNNHEGNSPTSEQSGGKFAAASKTSPDVEDINRDNTLNETETYYQYRISIRPEDLEVGCNFITDSRTYNATFKNNEKSEVTWYQFRVPIFDYETRVGPIEDFKSIRFMRMLLTGFQESVIMRFGTLELVRGEWRKYQLPFNDGGPSLTSQETGGSFDVSAVNIEENSGKTPVNYVLPPGIDRVIDPNQPQLRHLNEQSLLLKVLDLRDNDARAVFKNVDLDLRQYKNLRMFVHAEAIPGEMLQDDELTAFIRIGSDYMDNYYEYEVSLKVTEAGMYNKDSEADRKLVWPDGNIIELNLEKLVEVKKERNRLSREDPFAVSVAQVFRRMDPDHENKMIKVKGNPNLSNIRTIMLGIRNPGDANNIAMNDGQPKSAEVWFNELRLTDFNNRGGWAANARLQAKLADFGSVSIAGATSTPGFGGIEQTVEERSREEAIQYDIASNLELGKFFSEKASVSIPLYVGLSKTIINPEYYPGDPDVPLREALNNAGTREERNEIKRISQDRTERTSINFTNMRWNKEVQGLRVISPGNITAGVNYSETFSRNYNTDYNRRLKYGGNLNYVFNTRPKTITPFRKSKLLSKPFLRIIRDFNFNPYPSRFTFGTALNRNYNEMKMRNVFLDREIKIDSTVNKDFTWDRGYNLNWDFTRSLKFDYTANNVSRIDEPAGAYDLFKQDNDFWKDSVRQNILSGGRNTNFNQSFNLTYTLPINKIPLFDWMNLSTRYNATMSWVHGPVLADPSRDLGNNLKNSNSLQLNGQFNMNNLYNKAGFIKRIQDKYRSGGRQQPESERRYKVVNYSRRTFVRADVPKNVYHRLGTEDIDVKVFDEDGNEIDMVVNIENENKITIQDDQDHIGITVEVEGRIEKGENPLVFLGESFIRLLTGFKNISVSYRQNGGTFIQGYLPETDFFGMSRSGFDGAPGMPFLLGLQDEDFPYRAYRNNWLTRDTLFNSPYTITSTDDLSVRTTYEPFRGLRVEFSAQRQYSESISESYFYNRDSAGFMFDNWVQGGNFSMSFISIGSVFEKVSSDNNYQSEAYTRFRNYRKIISRRLHNRRVEQGTSDYNSSVEHMVIPGYYDGYGPTSSEVLIPAFMAAYGNMDPENITMKTFPWLMLPNWRVNFDGLARIAFLQQYFQSINITHSYRSTYNIGSYTTNLDFQEELVDGLTYIRDLQNNFIPEYTINSVSINEQISPLIGVDMTWKNSLITRFELKKSRMIALSLVNNQIMETRNDEVVIGTGYRFKAVPINITTGSGTRSFESDLNVRLDFSIRDNMTILRSDITNEPTVGQRIFKIDFTADYVLTERFNVQIFFDRTVNTPHTSRSFPTADTNIGFSVRFTL